MTVKNEEIEIDCSGFCADPIELQINAMTLMGLSNSLKCNAAFIKNNYTKFLCQEGIDHEVDAYEAWKIDCGEQIITKAASLAAGSRRLLQTIKNDFEIYSAPSVGIITIFCDTHDRRQKAKKDNSLDLHNACSRLVHSEKIVIRPKEGCHETELTVTTDSGGEYVICLSSFSLACWLLTKYLSSEVDEEGNYTSFHAPNLRLKRTAETA